MGLLGLSIALPLSFSRSTSGRDGGLRLGCLPDRLCDDFSLVDVSLCGFAAGPFAGKVDDFPVVVVAVVLIAVVVEGTGESGNRGGDTARAAEVELVTVEVVCTPECAATESRNGVPSAERGAECFAGGASFFGANEGDETEAEAEAFVGEGTGPTKDAGNGGGFVVGRGGGLSLFEDSGSGGTGSFSSPSSAC